MDYIFANFIKDAFYKDAFLWCEEKRILAKIQGGIMTLSFSRGGENCTKLNIDNRSKSAFLMHAQVLVVQRMRRAKPAVSCTFLSCCV